MQKVNRIAIRKALTPLKFTAHRKKDELKVHFHKGHAYTSDDERVNIVPCPLEFSGAVPLMPLLATLYRGGKWIDVTWQTGQEGEERSITIVNAGDTFHVSGTPPDLNDYDWYASKNLKWYPLPKDFFQHVDLLNRTVSKNVTLFKLSSIHCHPDYMEAGSEFALFRAYHKLPRNFDFLVRYDAFSSIPRNPNGIARTKRYCFFRYDTGLVVAIHIFNEQYLTLVQQHIEKERTGHVVQLPVELLEATKKAKKIDEDQEILYCTLDKGVFSIAAKDSGGQYVAKAKVDYTGDKVLFMIEASRLADVLALNRPCVIADDCIKIEDDTVVFLVSIIRGHKY